MHIISVMVIGPPNLSCHIHLNISACAISVSAFNNVMIGTNAISIFSIIIFSIIIFGVYVYIYVCVSKCVQVCVHMCV